MTNQDFELYYQATTGTDAKLSDAAWRGMAKWDDETNRRYVEWRKIRRGSK
jgi:hypothetical protein